jgi:hypothetical protein
MTSLPLYRNGFASGKMKNGALPPTRLSVWRLSVCGAVVVPLVNAGNCGPGGVGKSATWIARLSTICVLVIALTMPTYCDTAVTVRLWFGSGRQRRAEQLEHCVRTVCRVVGEALHRPRSGQPGDRDLLVDLEAVGDPRARVARQVGAVDVVDDAGRHGSRGRRPDRELVADCEAVGAEVVARADEIRLM